MPININSVAKTLSKLQNSSAILPVALLETTVIAGRSYQGYKRGGNDEFRERLIEETTSGGVWLFGIFGLNKLGDYIGKNFLKLKELDTDVGKDALRDPFSNIADAVKKKTGIFKFSKIALSTILATGFVGIVLPKINQKITRDVTQKKKDEHLKKMPPVAMSKFLDDSKPVSFKGGSAMNGLLSLSHNLEHNNVVRLITTDLGITSGRVATSRNKYEAREYLFRDIAATYFYMFATKNVMNSLFKASNTAQINPEAALEVQNYLVKKLGDGKTKDFENLALNKIIPEDILEKINFKNDVVKLDELKGILDEQTFKRAAEMSKLQPKINGERLLSKMQVKDALADNWLCDPELLRTVQDKATWGLASKENKFVSKSAIEKARNSVDEFAKGLLDYAKKKGIEEIDADLVKEFTKRNIKLNAAFTAAGFAVSIFGLSFLIPKAQQYMTYKATGKHAFPGTQNYS